MTPGEIVAQRYRIKAHIGRGGMQDVYLANDFLLDIDVALKTPQAGQGDKRFSQSAKLAARINHHNVAKTLDYIEEKGSLYLIEEYVLGDTLAQKLVRFQALDPHLSARVFKHIAKGLAASHHAGVIHRDIKPSNIISEPGVNLHNLKITDFGIATLFEEVFDEAFKKDGDLTQSTSGTIRGALPYMAPEMMFRAPGDHPGAPVDIWSLGAMMFQLMTGTHPFGINFEAAVNVRNQTRKPWPAFMVVNPQFKPLALELQNLVEKCLQYEPANRPTADELCAVLSEVCYINVPRIEAVVSNFIYDGNSGFAVSDGQNIFFSRESVYGQRQPGTSINNRICGAKFPGFPRARAHPIVVID